MSQADSIIVPLGLSEVSVINQETATDGELVLSIRYQRTSSPCPRCHRSSTKLHDERAQECRDVPLGDHPVRLRLLRRRFRCPRCRVRSRSGRWRPLIWSEPHPLFGRGPHGRTRRTTPRLRVEAGRAAMGQTVKRVAEHLAMGERWVRECWRDQVQGILRATHAEAGGMRWLGIDDFARRKGQRYDTLIADLQRRRVIDCVEGRDGKALRRWCEALPDPWTIEAVVIDMSATFRSVIELCLPRAMIVADHFHVVRRVGKALAQVRLRLQRQQAREGKKDLETLRAVVGRDPATWTKDERTQITALFADLPELERAWTLKEAFRAWYKLAERDEAAHHLVVWESHVRASGLREFRQLSEGEHAMLVNWREEILNFFPLRLTNGFVEGKNTRTKAFIRQAYGYRNRDNLRLRILQPAA